MDKLKTYAVPIVALVLMLVWFFVVRPMLAEPGAAEGDGKADGKAPAARSP